MYYLVKVSYGLVWLYMVLYGLTQLCTIFVLVFILFKWIWINLPLPLHRNLCRVYIFLYMIFQYLWTLHKLLSKTMKKNQSLKNWFQFLLPQYVGEFSIINPSQKWQLVQNITQKGAQPYTCFRIGCSKTCEGY